MSYLVRKINRAKWEATDSSTNDFAADAITICLKTRNNELSFWRLNTINDDEISKVIVAIMSSLEKIDTIDIAIIDENKIKDHCLIKDTPGNTPMDEMKNRHCDMVNLTYSKIGKIAELIYDEVKNKRSKRLTEKNLKGLILAAISSKQLSPESLHSSLRADLKLSE